MCWCKKCHCVSVLIVEGLDEDEMLNRDQIGGLERFAKQFPM